MFYDQSYAMIALPFKGSFNVVHALTMKRRICYIHHVIWPIQHRILKKWSSIAVLSKN